MWVSFCIALVVAALAHHILRDLIEVSFDPGRQSAWNILVGALQFSIVEAFLAIFNLFALVLLQRFLNFGQTNRPLGLSLLRLRTTVARVFLGRLQIINPWDTGQSEFFANLRLVSLAYGQLLALSAGNDAAERFRDVLDVEETSPSHL